MNITIDWGTKTIYIPKSELNLIQQFPIEIRELNINSFRMALKKEESTDGMLFPDTHRHNTIVTLSGIVFARVVEIINGYTVTFEDGNYAVNLVGANSNIADVVNLNKVSIRSANSAGLIQTTTISPISQQDKIDIANTIMDNTLSFQNQITNFLSNISQSISQYISRPKIVRS